MNLEKLAQNPVPLGPLRGIGPFGFQGTSPGQAPTFFNTIITTAIGLITIIAGIWFIFILLIGGIGWITAGGDKGALQAAQQRITMGIVGLAIVVAGLFIAEIIGGLLGFGGILEPASFLDALAP
jgi:hypothetical protein